VLRLAVDVLGLLFVAPTISTRQGAWIR